MPLKTDFLIALKQLKKYSPNQARKQITHCCEDFLSIEGGG